MLRCMTGTFIVLLCIFTYGSSDKAGEDKYYRFLEKAKNIMKGFPIRAVRLVVCIFKSEVQWQFNHNEQVKKSMTKEIMEHLIKQLTKVMKSKEKQLRTTIHCMDRYFWPRIIGVMAGNNYTQCLEDEYSKVLETFQGRNQTAACFRPPMHDLVNSIAHAVDIGIGKPDKSKSHHSDSDSRKRDCNCDAQVEEAMRIGASDDV